MRIGSVVFSNYPADPRPRREMEALAEAGMFVDIICLRKAGENREEVINGVRVFRLPVAQTRGRKLRYYWEYSWFILLAFLKLSTLHLSRPYDIVHVHNMPDILVLCALIPRLCGAKVILDLHDPMPEIYMTKYSVGAFHPAIQFLRILEKWSIRFADAVLTPNIAFRNLFVSRGCPEGKIHIVMNSPQESIFRRNCRGPKEVRRKEFVLMYHGAIMERNGLATALQAIQQVQNEVPNLRFEVYGDGDFSKQFEEYIEKLNLKKVVHFYGYRPLEVIAKIIETADVGIIPNDMSPFTNLNLPTRIFEYLCMGKPVIAPHTKGILDYFDEDSLYFFNPGVPQSLADRIVEIYRNPEKSRAILKRGMRVYWACRWEEERKHFVHVVKNLNKR